MKADFNNKPRVPQGWLRVLLFTVFYLSLLVMAGFVLKQWQQPPAPANQQTVAATPYLFFIIQALVSFAAVWLFRRFIDRRSFESIGLAPDQQGSSAATGFFLGILLVCTGTCILYFNRNLVWTNIMFDGNDLFISFGLMIIVAFYEEVVFRGYILNNLMASVNKWPALLISALLFALVHVANPDFSVIGACNIFIAGVLLGLNYIYTKSLWFGILLHFSWNFFQGPVLGFDVSGLPLQSLFQHEVQGSDLLTGGKFGFEGSLVATLLCLLAIIALVWVYEKKYTSWPVASADASATN